MFQWLNQPHPGALLKQKHEDGSLARELPEVHALYGVPQRADHHPEVDTGAHIELCLDAAHKLGASPAARFAVLMHDLGKAVTDKTLWPRHIDHESLGVPLVRRVCRRHSVSDYERDLALLVCEYHLHAHRVMEMRPQSVMALLEDHGMVSSPQLLEDYLFACESDARGRKGLFERHYPQASLLRQSAKALQDLLPPETVGEPQSRAWQERHRARLVAMRDIRKSFEETKPESVC